MPQQHEYNPNIVTKEYFLQVVKKKDASQISTQKKLYQQISKCSTHKKIEKSWREHRGRLRKLQSIIGESHIPAGHDQCQ